MTATSDRAYAVRRVQDGLWWSQANDWGPFGSSRVYDTGPRAMSAFLQSALYSEASTEQVEIVEIRVSATTLWCAINC